MAKKSKVHKVTANATAVLTKLIGSEQQPHRSDPLPTTSPQSYRQSRLVYQCVTFRTFLLRQSAPMCRHRNWRTTMQNPQMFTVFGGSFISEEHAAVSTKEKSSFGSIAKVVGR